MPQSFDSHNPPFDRLTPRRDQRVAGGARHRLFPPRRSDRRAQQRLRATCTSSSRGRSRNATTTTSRRSSARKTASTPARWCTAPLARASSPPRRRSAISRRRRRIRTLIRRNPGFAAFFYSEISRKLEGYSRRQGPEGVDSVLRARVRDARTHPAVFIDGAETIEAAGQLMRERDNNALFVRDGERSAS